MMKGPLKFYHIKIKFYSITFKTNNNFSPTSHTLAKMSHWIRGINTPILSTAWHLWRQLATRYYSITKTALKCYTTPLWGHDEGPAGFGLVADDSGLPYTSYPTHAQWCSGLVIEWLILASMWLLGEILLFILKVIK